MRGEKSGQVEELLEELLGSETSPLTRCLPPANLAAFRYSSLLEEATYHKNHAQQLERENRRLADQHKYSRKSKKQLAAKVVALEAEIQKERRERAAMEEALTEAYSTALREMVALQESTAVARAAPTGGRRIKGGNFR